jgi:hypothetical protein
MTHVHRQVTKKLDYLRAAVASRRERPSESSKVSDVVEASSGLVEESIVGRAALPLRDASKAFLPYNKFLHPLIAGHITFHSDGAVDEAVTYGRLID